MCGRPAPACWTRARRLRPPSRPRQPPFRSGPSRRGGALPPARPVTIANLGSSPVTLAVVVAPQAQPAGATVATDKSSLSLGAAGTGTASATFNLSFAGALPAVGSYFGSVNLTGSGVSMH